MCGFLARVRLGNDDRVVSFAGGGIRRARLFRVRERCRPVRGRCNGPDVFDLLPAIRLKHAIVVVGFVECFVLRNPHRHFYSRELYEGFGVSSVVNDLTTVFFAVQAIAMAALLWSAARSVRITRDSPFNVQD